MSDKSEKAKSLKEKLDQLESNKKLFQTKIDFDNQSTHSFLNAIPFPLFIIDDKLEFIFFNSFFRNIFKNNIIENSEGHSFDLLKDQCRNVLENKSVLEFEFSLELESKNLYTKLYLNYAENKDSKYVIGIMFDVTDEVEDHLNSKSQIEELTYSQEIMEENAREISELNAQLAISEAELQKAIQQRDKFFSIVAHDLRSPFTALLGYSGILKDEATTLDKEELQEYTFHLHSAINSFYKLVENLLTWSRVQRKKIEKSQINFDIKDLVEEVFDVLKSNAAQKLISLETNIYEQKQIYADRMMVETIVRNLVANSIKYTSDGFVRVELTEKENEYLFSVSDNGIGMSEEIANQLFKIDGNVSRNGTNGEKGTGLGLMVSKEFVELHDGKIWVESEEGNGSTFFFTIKKEFSPE